MNLSDSAQKEEEGEAARELLMANLSFPDTGSGNGAQSR